MAIRQSIWKFAIGDCMENEIAMPSGATILSVQMQNNIPTLWALVDADAKPVTRRFSVVGTGWAMGTAEDAIDIQEKKYLATLQDRNGFVWHVFENLE